MASSYLTLYGNYEKKTWDRNSNVYRSPVDQASQVVHDQVNNIYYGIHSQADTVKYLTNAVAQSQKLVNSATGQRFESGARGGGKYVSYNYSTAEKNQQKQQLANQQKYLSHINNGGYKQEANTFFDSYDAYTNDWNNVFVGRKNNADAEARNAKQRAENEATLARNKKIEGENQIREAKASQLDTQLAVGSNAKAKSLSPNLEIGTGISAVQDQIVKSLNTGLSL